MFRLINTLGHPAILAPTSLRLPSSLLHRTATLSSYPTPSRAITPHANLPRPLLLSLSTPLSVPPPLLFPYKSSSHILHFIILIIFAVVLLLWLNPLIRPRDGGSQLMIELESWKHRRTKGQTNSNCDKSIECKTR